MNKKILLRLANNHISIDIINIFPDKMVFTIDGFLTDKAVNIINEINNNFRVLNNCTKVSVIGERMRGVPV